MLHAAKHILLHVIKGLLYVIWAFAPLAVAWSILVPSSSPLNPFSVGHILVIVYTFGPTSLIMILALAMRAEQFRWDLTLWALANACIVAFFTALLLIGYSKIAT